MNTFKDFIRNHKVGSLISITIIAIMAVLMMPMTPTNLYYKADFTSIDTGSEVAYVFDANESYPSSSRQHASIQGNSALIHLDPLNQKSQRLSIEVKKANVHLSGMSVYVQAPGLPQYTIAQVTANNFHNEFTGGSSRFVLHHDVLSVVQHKSKLLAETKIYLCLFIALLFVILILRLTLLRNILITCYIFGILGTILLLLFLFSLWSTHSHLLNSRFPYRSIATGIVLTFLALGLLNCLQSQSSTRGNHRTSILMNYLVVGVYAICQFPLYIKYLQGFPDEQAHLSYIAFLKVNGGIIPDFPDMRVYNVTAPGILDLTQVKQFNYLGHPPLYYQIMRILGGMTVRGDTVLFHINWMRLLSFGIGMLGIALIFYIGFTRIRPIPMLHLLFATIVISPPNMLFVMSGLSNDSLTLLTVSIFALGVIRFSEKKYDLLTFMLIAVGVSASLLTKLTAGMIVCIAAVLILVYTFAVERKGAKAILNRNFYISLPLYMLPMAYFSLLYVKYHTIQPSYKNMAFTEYVQSGMYTPNDSRTSMNIVQYVEYYISKFFESWYAIHGHVAVPRDNLSFLSLATIAISLILIIPLLIFLKKDDQQVAYMKIGLIAVLLTFAYQFNNAFNGFYINGYLGGFQSRYYLCAIVLFALAAVKLVHDRCIEDDIVGVQYLTYTGRAICLAALLLLVTDGFICSFLVNMDKIVS